jgi:hypothetical protein
MRSFAYKNAVWKSSWYQKHGASAESVLPLSKTGSAAPAGTKSVPGQKAWPWHFKEKAAHIEHKR